MAISTTIKSIQDIMRQDTGVDAQRISQLVWRLFLKIFDDKEQEYEFDPAKLAPFETDADPDDEVEVEEVTVVSKERGD